MYCQGKPSSRSFFRPSFSPTLSGIFFRFLSKTHSFANISFFLRIRASFQRNRDILRRYQTAAQWIQLLNQVGFSNFFSPSVYPVSRTGVRGGRASPACISRAATACEWMETISRYPIAILSPATAFAFLEETRTVKVGDRLVVSFPSLSFVFLTLSRGILFLSSDSTTLTRAINRILTFRIVNA